jgi:hypothetical protein
MEREAQNARARRRGGRIGLVLFGILVSGATAIWTVQIIRQVWWPPFQESAVDCGTGLAGLAGAITRARLAAARESGDERAALARFRRALEPEWIARSGVEARCEGDPEALSSLRDLDALRYAEEHAVRYETVDLAPLRRRVESMQQKLGPRAAFPASPGSLPK